LNVSGATTINSGVLYINNNPVSNPGSIGNNLQSIDHFLQ
jgi:hypothetical protein